MIIDYTKAGLLIRNVNGSIPLHIAVSNSQSLTVKKLIDVSPAECLFTENGVGSTPLEIATLNVLLDRMKITNVVPSFELGAEHVHMNPARINLEKLKRDVPALRKTIAELLTEDVLKPDDKLTKELSSFARLMETKLAAAEAEVAQSPKTKEDSAEELDPENREATYNILQETVLARPSQRQLIHLIDVQKSVAGDLSNAFSSTYDGRKRKDEEEGLGPEEDKESKLKVSGMVYKYIGLAMEDNSCWKKNINGVLDSNVKQ